MTLRIYMECDVTSCINQATPEGADLTPITLETSEFVIDQHFELPDGWAYTDDLSTYPEGLHLCPEHARTIQPYKLQKEGTPMSSDPSKRQIAVQADTRLGQMVVEAAAASRDGIGDSDLDDDQPVTVMISTTLGMLRKAGLRYIPGYYTIGAS